MCQAKNERERDRAEEEGVRQTSSTGRTPKRNRMDLMGCDMKQTKKTAVKTKTYIHREKKIISLSAVRWRRRSGCGPFFESHTRFFEQNFNQSNLLCLLFQLALFKLFRIEIKASLGVFHLKRTTRLFFLVQLAENNQTNKNHFVIVKTIVDFKIFCCILVLLKVESECN